MPFYITSTLVTVCDEVPDPQDLTETQTSPERQTETVRGAALQMLPGKAETCRTINHSQRKRERWKMRRHTGHRGRGEEENVKSEQANSQTER